METKHSGLFDRLAEIVGKEGLILSPEEIRFFALDLSEQPGPIPAAVASPRSAEEVGAVVRACSETGYAVVARGAGVSYTRAHVPVQEKTVVIDLRGLNKIREINLRDRYVIVETGVTWFQLREALAGSGYRVPYGGTYSGRVATIGGGLSQNATGMGRGTLAEHVMGLEVVLGNGSIVQTGSSMIARTPPFYRYNGPDLTGMFLCDSGAFGIKTTAVLLLEPVPNASYGVFAFNSETDLVRAQAEMIGAGHSFESFGWGKNFLRSLAEGPVPSAKEQFGMAADILRKAPNKYRAARALWRAWSPNGLSYLKKYLCAMYVIAEAHSEAEADRIMSALTKLAKKAGATVLPSTLGFASRHGPYPDIGGLLFSKDDEIWFPVNGKFPMSRIEDALKAVQDFTAEAAPKLQRHNIRLECNFLTHGYFCGLEPIFFWKRRSPYREHFAPARGGNTALVLPEIDETTATVHELRDALIRRMRELGALQLQWGKLYPYAESLGPDEQRFVAEIKRAVDPNGIINPGVLGLDRIPLQSAAR